MTTFPTYNQFDQKFKDLSNFGNDRNACPLFALFTAKHFMDNGDLSKQQHEHNLDAAVANYLANNIPKYISFDELVQFTGTWNDTHIQATTPQLIMTGVLGYDSIFSEHEQQKYCVIFLKNSNFIVVMVKEDGTYAVRDCHEKVQYQFDNIEALKARLNMTYQFDQLTVVDGVLIEEFANIEFLVVDQPFEIIELDPDLYDAEEPDIENEPVEDLIKKELARRYRK